MISDIMVTTLLKEGLRLNLFNSQKKSTLEAGTAYIVKEEKPDQSYKAFLELSKQKDGLVITRIHPHRVRKRFNITGDILWLSTIETHNTIEPTQLSKLAFIIGHFVKTNKGGAILLDGLEYLIMQNDFKTVLRFVYSVMDYISLHKAILLLPISPKILSKSQIKMLERELDPY